MAIPSTFVFVRENPGKHQGLDEVLSRFSPEAEALLDELLPSWRSSAA
jgi:hypothetical protein